MLRPVRSCGFFVPRAFWKLLFRLRGTAIEAIRKNDLLALLDKQFGKKSLLSDQRIF